MPTAKQQQAHRLQEEGLTYADIGARMGITMQAARSLVRAFRKNAEREANDKLGDLGYDLDAPDITPQAAWDAHADVTSRSLAQAARKRWPVIKRPKGPFCIFHSTDEHVDADGALLRVIEQDIQAAHDLGAIMCHGGDLLNNWPLAGRLAKKWADQECTLPNALLRAQHFIDIFKPDVWTDGNHEEMNPYLRDLMGEWLPKHVIRDYWSVNFVVRTPGGRDARVIMSHKFQKGSSWFHKLHGHIREMLEGEEADLLMDGHLHSDGVLDHTLPEREVATLCVASAGYKSGDEFARRISKGSGLPKLRGRAHWIIGDPQADHDANMFQAFKCPRQAEAYMDGLQNLRAA